MISLSTHVRVLAFIFVIAITQSAGGTEETSSNQTAPTADCATSRVAQGCGTYAWPDGSKYVGGFRGGYFDGPGVLYFSDGSRLEAQFSNSSPYGDATYIRSDGTKIAGPFHDVGNDMSRPHSVVRYPFWRSLFGGTANVLISAIVSENGDVVTLQIDQPTGYPSFEQAAMEGVMQWKYLPATIADKPVRAPHPINLQFSRS